MIHRSAKVFCLLLSSILVLGGCAAGGSNARHPGQPVQGGTLIYATNKEPTCLDPHVSGDMPQVFVAQQFLDSLVSQDDKGNIGPWLATSWEVSPDGKSYTFRLRDDVAFTDGTKFDANAVKANLDHMKNPKTQSSTAGGYIRQYVGTEIVDPYTARVRLTEPYAAFLEVLAQGFLGIESPTALQRSREENCARPVGSGPFIVQRWDHQDKVVMTRNPGYRWAPPTARHQGPAHLDGIEWKFIPEPSVRFASLQAGEVDVIEGLPPENHEAARRNPALELILANRPGNPTNLTLNTTREPFRDIRVREAFIRASDVQGALDSVYFKEFSRSGGPLSSATRFYDPQFEGTGHFDIGQANALLDAAGWTARDDAGYRTKNGRRLSAELPVVSTSSPSEITLYEQIQASAKQAGFDIRLQMMDKTSETQRQASWKYDLSARYWNTNTADVLRIVFGSEFLTPAGVGGYHQNTAGFNNPEFDSVMKQALGTQDPQRRRDLYSQAQRIAAANYLQLTLYPQDTRLAAYRTAYGVRLEPSLSVTSLYDAWVTK